jgi:2-dehydropantoate 2-reductase
MLARAGNEVVLVARAQHVEAVRRHGLRLQAMSFDEHVSLQASTEASAAQGAQLVLFCVKSTDTESAGAAMAPFLAPDATILSLQNGVDNAERLSRLLGRAVVPAVVYVAAEMAGAGHVLHHGRGDLVIGPAPHSDRLVAAFAAAGVPVQVSSNVVGALWAKLIVNCAYNAVSAITQLAYGRMVRGPGVPEMMHDVVQECLAVAAALRIDVPHDIAEAVPRIALTMAGQLSSTAQDLARAKPTEIDHLNGYVVRQGAACGVATPVNRCLQALVKLIEAKAY